MTINPPNLACTTVDDQCRAWFSTDAQREKGLKQFSLRNSLGVNALETGQMLISAGTMRQPTSLILKNFVQGRPCGGGGRRSQREEGKTARKRAVVAVARKLAVLLHRLWVSGEAYEPLRKYPEGDDRSGIEKLGRAKEFAPGS